MVRASSSCCRQKGLKMNYQVLIVEDEEWIRKGLIKSICWESLGLALAGEASNGLEALTFLSQYPVDILITDMRMPACDGSSLLRQIEELSLNCKILVLSEFSDFTYMRQAIHAKVFDYLLKPIDSDQLNDALQRIVTVLNTAALRRADLTDRALSDLLAALEGTEPLTEQIIHYLTKTKSIWPVSRYRCQRCKRVFWMLRDPCFRKQQMRGFVLRLSATASRSYCCGALQKTRVMQVRGLQRHCKHCIPPFPRMERKYGLAQCAAAYLPKLPQKRFLKRNGPVPIYTMGKRPFVLRRHCAGTPHGIARLPFR